MSTATLTRTSGILLHPTSLPSPYGIGDMGIDAYEFVDFLQKSGQHLWQTLPLTPTGFGDSPYQSFSAFALNPYFIDLDRKVNSTVLGDKLVKEPKNSKEVKVTGATLYKIKNGTVVKCYSGIEAITNVLS